MFKATRALIKARQPYTKYALDVVSVKKIDGGVANKCFENATDDDLLNAGNSVVSGWLVNAYDKETNSTAIVQHWWNIDKNGQFFDTTPGIATDYEYLVDTDICEYGQDNFDELDNLIGLSLLYTNDQFFSVEMVDGSLVKKPIHSLATENLFQFTA